MTKPDLFAAGGIATPPLANVLKTPAERYQRAVEPDLFQRPPVAVLPPKGAGQ